MIARKGALRNEFTDDKYHPFHLVHANPNMYYNYFNQERDRLFPATILREEIFFFFSLVITLMMSYRIDIILNIAMDVNLKNIKN